MKSLFIILLCLPLQLFAFTNNYSSNTRILTLPSVVLDNTTVYQDVFISFNNDGMCKVNSFVENQSGILNPEFVIEGRILNYAGIRANSIFKISNGLTWQVLSSETKSLEYIEIEPEMTIYKLKTGSFSLRLHDIVFSIEPFIYRYILASKIQLYFGLQSQRMFSTSNGQIWQSDVGLPYPVGSDVIIYDQKFLVINGATYAVKLVG